MKLWLGHSSEPDFPSSHVQVPANLGGDDYLESIKARTDDIPVQVCDANSAASYYLLPSLIWTHSALCDNAKRSLHHCVLCVPAECLSEHQVWLRLSFATFHTLFSFSGKRLSLPSFLCWPGIWQVLHHLKDWAL